MEVFVSILNRVVDEFVGYVSLIVATVLELTVRDVRLVVCCVLVVVVPKALNTLIFIKLLLHKHVDR